MNTTTVFDGRLSIEQVEEGQTLAPKFDAQGLIACVTTEVHSGEVLMPGYMNAEAMQSAPIGDALAVVCIGRGAKVLEAINQPGVELAAWQRGRTGYPFVDAGMHPVLLLVQLPSSLTRDRLLAQIQAGEKVVGLAWQEHAGDLNATPPKSVALVYGETHMLVGTKRFVRPGS